MRLVRDVCYSWVICVLVDENNHRTIVIGHEAYWCVIMLNGVSNCVGNHDAGLVRRREYGFPESYDIRRIAIRHRVGNPIRACNSATGVGLKINKQRQLMGAQDIRSCTQTVRVTVMHISVIGYKLHLRRIGVLRPVSQHVQEHNAFVFFD